MYFICRKIFKEQIKLEDVRSELKDQNRITSIKASQSVSDSIVTDMPNMQTIINGASMFTHTINQAKINQDLKPAKQKALDICIKADQLETNIIPLVILFFIEIKNNTLFIYRYTIHKSQIILSTYC